MRNFQLQRSCSYSHLHRVEVVQKGSEKVSSVELIHVGFDNHLALNRAMAIATPASAPTKRLIQRGKEERHIIDLTSGRRTKAVVVLDNGWVALLAITPETFANRVEAMRQVQGEDKC